MTQILRIHPIHFSHENNISIPRFKSGHDSAGLAIHYEKREHIKKSNHRSENFENILQNNFNLLEPQKHILSGLAGILLPIVVTSIYTLVPVHNLILFPQYWYEWLLQFCLSFLVSFAANMVLRFYYVTNIKFVKTIRAFIVVWFVCLVCTLTVFTIATMIWIYGLRYHNPVPLKGYFLYLTIAIAIPAIFWYHFPKEWHKNRNFRLRFQFYVVGYILNLLQFLGYSIITKSLLVIPDEYQWVMAMFLPFVRIINLWLQMKLSRRSSDGDFHATRIFQTQKVFLGYSLFLAYTVGSIATLATSLVIIFEDYLINLLVCLKLLYLQHKDQSPECIEKQTQLLQDLMISEWVEVLSPLCYLLCFLMGYYGPNKDLLGNIGSSYWQYNAVDDVNHTIKYLIIFFLVDVSSLLLCGFLLWYFGKINLYNAFAALQEEFGLVFAVSLAGSLNGVIRNTIRNYPLLKFIFI